MPIYPRAGAHGLLSFAPGQWKGSPTLQKRAQANWGAGRTYLRGALWAPGLPFFEADAGLCRSTPSASSSPLPEPANLSPTHAFDEGWECYTFTPQIGHLAWNFFYPSLDFPFWPKWGIDWPSGGPRPPKGLQSGGGVRENTTVGGFLFLLWWHS